MRKTHVGKREHALCNLLIVPPSEDLQTFRTGVSSWNEKVETPLSEIENIKPENLIPSLGLGVGAQDAQLSVGGIRKLARNGLRGTLGMVGIPPHAVSTKPTSGPESFSEYRSIDPAPALRPVCCARNTSML